MLLIGDHLRTGSPLVEIALRSKDKRAIQELAARQVEAGAGMLSVDLGPEKKRARGRGSGRVSLALYKIN